MKKALIVALAMSVAAPAVAGSLAPVVVEPSPEVIVEDTSSSGGGLLVPLLFLLIIAAVASQQ
jgi:hypothetical protein